MKNKETDFLNELFASSSGENDESETDFPLVDVPENLADKLYAITESAAGNTPSIKKLIAGSWPKITSIAASLLVAVVVFQVYQQQQTLKQLEQAQADLATALHYLGEANKITRTQMRISLNENMKKAAIEPVVEIGRDSVLPSLKTLEPETKTQNRTL